MTVDQGVTSDHLDLLAASAARIPERFKVAPGEMEEATRQLAEPYADYTATTSTPAHAMSLQAAAFLLCLCRRLKPRRVVDLGSGFSSYVLARYAQESPHVVQVQSVDDDRDWLTRTEEFLERHHLRAWTRTRMWDTFSSERHIPYDFIFHDLAGGKIREEAMAWVCGAVRVDGVAVFDDIHHLGHCESLLAATAAAGLAFHSLHPWTMDDSLRFSALAVAPDAQSLRAQYEAACRTPSDIHQHLPMFVELVDQLDARRVLELGTRTGVSTLAWLYALEGSGSLTSVDLDGRPPIGNYDHWQFIQGDDMDPAIIAKVSNPPPDIVFLDTSHHYQHTRRELATYRWVVRDGGVIICHDTEVARPEGAPLGDPAFPVRRAIEEFCRDNGFTWVNVSGCNGLGIIRIS